MDETYGHVLFKSTFKRVYLRYSFEKTIDINVKALLLACCSIKVEQVLPGDHSEREPPDPISNSEVKTFSADDSLGFPHAKVGHCQALIKKKSSPIGGLFF